MMPHWPDLFDSLEEHDEDWEDQYANAYSDLDTKEEPVKLRDQKNEILPILNERRKAQMQYTPDYFLLKKEIMIPVFVYGSLKKGLSNHFILQGCPYLGEGETYSEHWMKEYPGGKFPMVFKGDYKNGEKKKWQAPIRGEIYMVYPSVMLELDFLEGNGSLYKRERTPIYAYQQKFRSEDGERMLTPTLSCWMYFAGPKSIQANIGQTVAMTLGPDKKEFYEW